MNTLLIKNKKAKLEKLLTEFPDALIIDVTSQGVEPWVRFSPFYPHGNIPIPFSKPHTADSVEGIWQGLKVFEREGIDTSKFHNKSMKNIKRSIRTRGPIIGHQQGINSSATLTYLEAREKIYIPSYYWVLKNCIPDLVITLQKKLLLQTVVLLDYQVNDDPKDPSTPLSHAALIKKYLEEQL